MHKASSILTGVGAFLVAGAVALPARAGCCDNFWSCMGAVATAGLSCAVEAAQDEIDKFVARVEQTRDEGKRRMSETSRRLESEAGSACGAEHRATQQQLGALLTAEAIGKRAADQSKAERSTAVNQTLQQAQAQLNTLVAQARAGTNESSTKLSEATRARQSKLSALNTTFEASFIAPLTGLVAPLLAAADPVTAVATIALLSERIMTIQRETDRKVAGAIEGFDATVEAHVKDLRGKKEAEQQRAARGKLIAEAMKTLNEAPNEANRRKLQQLLDPSAKPAVVPAIALKAPFVLRASDDSKRATLPQLSSQLVSTAAFASAIQAPPAPQFDRKVAQERTASELDRRLKGKTGQAFEEEKKKLLDELRARFKHAKTRAAIEKALLDEIEKRKPLAAPVKAPIAPRPPIVPKAPIKN